MSNPDSLWDEKRAERYVRLYGDPREKVGTQSQLCKTAAKLVRGTSILDFGCGMGHIIPYIDQDGYVGLDYSKTMLEYLGNFFPNVTTIYGDATAPTEKVIETLESQHLPTSYDTTVSLSLAIHLPTVNMVRDLLQNMWALCTQAMILGVETVGNKIITRPDGLTLRNISVGGVYKLLEGIVPSHKIQYVHQKILYQPIISVFPFEDPPLIMQPPQILSRTTLFIAQK